MRTLLYLLSTIMFVLEFSVGAQSILPTPATVNDLYVYQKLDENLNFGVRSDLTVPLVEQGFTDFKKRLQSQCGLKAFYANALPDTKYRIRKLADSNALYRLTITDSIIVEANSAAGFDAAFTSLLQLIDKSKGVWRVAQLEITDAPLVHKRILKIDLTHDKPDISFIKQQLKLMQYLKLNQLVMVLSNKDICLYPFKGLARSYSTYTKAELKEVVDVAAKKNIAVVPEISLPVISWMVDINPSIGIEMTDELSLPNLLSSTTWVMVEDMISDLKTTFSDSTVILSSLDTSLPEDYTNILKATTTRKDWQTEVCERLVPIAKRNSSVFVLDEQIFRPVDKRYLVIRVHSKAMVEVMMSHNLRVYAGSAITIDESWDGKAVFDADRLPDEDVLGQLDGAEIVLPNSWYKRVNMEARLWPAAIDGAQLLWAGVPTITFESYAVAKDACSLALEALGSNHLCMPYAVLREVVATENIIPLMVLLQTLEPVVDVTDELVLADAAIMEPYGARSFNHALREFIIAGKNEKNFIHVRDMLQVWINNGVLLQPFFNAHPQYKELRALSNALTEIAQIGDLALYNSVKAKTPKKSWVVASKKKLESYRTPKAGVEFAIIDGIDALLQFSEEHDVIEF